MKIYQLQAELEVRNEEATAYVQDEHGNVVPVHAVYNIMDDSKHPDDQDVLIMPKF